MKIIALIVGIIVQEILFTVIKIWINKYIIVNL